MPNRPPRRGRSVVSARALRLDRRFRSIQRAAEQVYGRERAFGAACVAWLFAIQYAAEQCFRAAKRGASMQELDREIQDILQGFHREICKYLAVDQKDSIEISRAFKEVVSDICNQKG